MVTPTKAPRRQFLVNARMQLSVALTIVGTLFALTLVYVLGAVLYAGDELGPTSDALLRIGVTVTGLFFLLVLLATLTVSVMTTQRIAGPAMVIERAVRGLRTKDYSQRLVLRKKDHMKSLASEVVALRDELQQAEARRRKFQVSLAAALSRGDCDRGAALAKAYFDERAGADATKGAPGTRESGIDA